MKTLEFLSIALLLLFGIFALFYITGQFILFIERFINPFVFASVIFGVVIYGVLNLFCSED